MSTQTYNLVVIDINNVIKTSSNIGKITTSTGDTLPTSYFDYLSEFTTNNGIIANHKLILLAQLQSNVTDGTTPMLVTSTTKVANLNADRVDDYHFNQSLLVADSPTFVDVTSSLINNAFGSYVKEVRNVYGIPIGEKSKWAFSYDPSTRIFTITISSTSYYVCAGVRYNLTAGTYTTTAHANTNGMWYLYYNSSGVLTVSNTVWDILVTTQLYSVYYNSNNNGGGVAYIPFYELHSTAFPSTVHNYEHTYEGTRFNSGATLSSYVIQSDTVADTTYAISSATFSDEDNNFTADAVPDGGNYLIGWFDASNNFNWTETASLPYLIGSTPRLQYNLIGTGLAEVPNSNNQYVNYYILCINHYTSSKRYLILPSQTIYSTLGAAQAETTANLNLGNIPFKEFIFIYQITLRYGTAYSTTTGRSRIEATPVRINVSTSSIAGFASNHNLLSGLQLSAFGVTWGHINDQAQTIGGEKTFTAMIFTPQIITTSSSVAVADISTGNVFISTEVATARSIQVTGFGTRTGTYLIYVAVTNSAVISIASKCTGVITTSAGNKSISGAGTKFLTELFSGQILYRLSDNSALGTIDTITNDTTAQFLGNGASSNTSITFGVNTILETTTITPTSLKAFTPNANGFMLFTLFITQGTATTAPNKMHLTVTRFGT